MHGMSDLPVPLRRYLLAVIAAAPVAALAPLLIDPSALDVADPWRVIVLLLLTVAAERSTIYLTHKTHVSPVTACYLALVLACQMELAAPLALVAALTGQLLRRKSDAVEATFNACQGTLAVLSAALTFHALDRLDWLGPRLADVGTVGALIGTAAVLHLTNTALVALAAALHLGRSPARVFLVHLREGVAAHLAQLILGVTLARLAMDAPILTLTLVVPLWLVRRSQRETVRLREDTHAALATLVEVVEMRDPYTAGHSQRVADLAHSLALDLGLTHEEADLIADAGRVHDIGKLAIDPAILAKPGRLSEAETAQMRQHPVLGADVVARFGAYWGGVPMVRHHHEAWDGSGYPDGKKGEAIPLGARILAVADAYDALTSDRPYRAGFDRTRTLAILRTGAGTSWDPAVVAAILAHLDPGARGAPARLPVPSVPATARQLPS